jgi:glycosyltransferase involved in cell wall biosynthesis
MNKPTLLFQGPVATRSGYGDHARDLLYSFWKLDKFEIKIVSTRWGYTPMDALNYENEFHRWIVSNIVSNISSKPDIYVQVSVPNEFQPVGHYNIGVTAGIETTHCAHDWIIGSNRMDLVIVPSQHSNDTISKIVFNETDKNTGQIIQQINFSKSMEILFEGYDESQFNSKNIVPIKDLDDVQEDFCFLFVGHWLKGSFGEDRKNIGMLLKTFAVAFKNETIKPALILKTSHATFSIRDREQIIAKIKNCLGADFGKIPVYLLHGDMTQKEMNSLYHHPKVKSMISFTKGEGYGRPLLEFSITGKPVIVSNWSGHLDFLKKGAVLLDGELKDVHESAADQFLLKESKWFNVNVSKALPIIKDVYKNYHKYRKESEELAKNNSINFTLSKMTQELDRILTNYNIYSKAQPKFQQLQLPKLKTLDNKK